MHETTIVLPCAGEGRRLGLPFPKELAPVSPGRAVIDSCLTIISEASTSCRIILMDDGKRESTRKYITDRLPDVPLAMVRQHRYSSDMADAVIRLMPWFGDVNILMLPDVIYQVKSEPIGELSALTGEYGFALAAARRESVKDLGALSVAQDDTVRAYQDKPVNSAPYNAAWGMVGFSGPVGIAGLRVMASSVTRLRAGRPPVVGAPVVWLESFRDCGTWDGYIDVLCH